MGLDQTAFASKRGVKKKEIAYWRKHPNLEGWMANRYYEKGGEGDFNCKDLFLDENDLNDLEAAVNGSLLPATQGFFFGNSCDDDYRENDLEFIYKARAHLQDGYRIRYTSWW